MHTPRALHERHQEQDESAAASGFAPRTPSILVVDDSRISRQIAERSLSRAKLYVEVAPDGEVGLARLQAQPSSFDLILLDVVMPGLDGVEVLTRVKQDPQLSHIPVVMLSGLESDRLEEVCLQQGAVVVLRKPLTAEKVVQVVEAYCAQREGAAAGAGAEEAPPPSGGEGHSPPRDLPPGIDASAGFEHAEAFPSTGAGLAPGVPPPPEPHPAETKGPLGSAPTGGGGGGGGDRGLSGSPSRRESASSTLPTANMTVLVVEDSVISSKLAIQKLRALGCSTISVENGRAALDLMRGDPDRISLVLADVIMPVMDGIELLRVVKDDPILRKIPVVVVSSLERRELEALCLESGALAVLRKPFRALEIQEIAAQAGLALPKSPTTAASGPPRSYASSRTSNCS
ncbi:unnamed protein product [Ectocarpus sp. CCAP 1310/34]|nr:unnamed protein product [Ectocarpus sp. CCAP 1310/34]